MDYEKLKEVIAKQIKENGRGEITGPILQAVLMAMVDSLGEVYPQNYTEEEKARARANIDALSNYDGEITKEKLSAEVQAILNDVANKQNITDESLATIAKTIIGAINEVYKGGLEDASIATSKIEDGAVTEPKLNDVLVAKVNNNVKVVEQALTDAEIIIALKNLKIEDLYENFFVDLTTYDDIAKLSYKPSGCVFGISGINIKFGSNCSNIIFGSRCNNIIFGHNCSNIIFGSNCSNMTLGSNLQHSKFDSGVSYIALKRDPESFGVLQNIHILSGVNGSPLNWLTISIPDEYLNSSRELIITTKRTDGGPSTPEDIVMYYADEVVDKQNKQDATLETTSKEVVGAINELFNGGVKNNSITTEKLKDQAVEYAKLSASIRSTLDMIGTNVKVLSSGTDLKAVAEAGVYILSGTADYLNAPNKWEHYNTAILIVTGDNSNSYNRGKTIIGFQSGSRYPFAATLRGNEWTETDLDTALNGKLNKTSTLSDTEINNIWDNN